MSDEIIEKIARAICRQPGSLCVGFCHQPRCGKAIEMYGADARAAYAVMAGEIALMRKSREADEEEACNLGKRDGREAAVQRIDMLTGGDGEYRYAMNACGDERRCPDADTMEARIQERFTSLQEQLKTVLEREAETIRRYDRRLDALQEQVKRLTEALARVKSDAQMAHDMITPSTAVLQSIQDGFGIISKRAGDALAQALQTKETNSEG